jgi:NAD(P)-dependent dehydrogenase (short-subunit alcohol dehydrogenase family)
VDRLKDKIAIVTGASRGIGEGIAHLFAEEGASVVVAARSKDRLERVAQSIQEKGGQALPVVTDVSVAADVRRMVEAAVERFGALDVLVNNAAIASFTRELDAEDLEAEYDRLMDTNVKSTFMGIHYALPHFKARGGGSVINITSVHATASGKRMSAYAASKGALVAGTRAMAVELAPHKIRVNCISPGTIWLDEPGGWIRHRFGEEMHREFMERFGSWAHSARENQQPLPVPGLPKHVAYCAVYLASDESTFTTGADHLVDGGMTSVLSDPHFLPPGAREQLIHRPEIQAWIAEARERFPNPPGS